MSKVSKRSVRYRRALPWSRKRCRTCSMIRPKADGKGWYCTLVAGPIRPNDTCDRWDAA